MSYRTVEPDEAKRLADSGEWVYLDVRSAEEFAAGHPEGAYNVPIAHAAEGGLAPNPDFAAVVGRNFAPDARLLVGCAMGGRSARACELLAAQGFRNLVNVHGGFSGARDVPGWKARGFPTASGEPPERSYAHLRARR